MPWLAEVAHILDLAIHNPQNAYVRGIKQATDNGSYSYKFNVITRTLESLLRDIDAGLLGNLANKVRAETFDDFLDHAEEYKKVNRKNEAGVIAGVVFEDTIRRVYQNTIGDPVGEKVENIISALSSKGVLTGQQSKQARVASHVRTKATHANWDDFDLAGVENTIQFTRALLREHFGG